MSIETPRSDVTFEEFQMPLKHFKEPHVQTFQKQLKHSKTVILDMRYYFEALHYYYYCCLHSDRGPIGFSESHSTLLSPVPPPPEGVEGESDGQADGLTEGLLDHAATESCSQPLCHSGTFRS